MKQLNNVKNNESGIAHLLVIVIIAVVSVVAVGWYVYSQNSSKKPAQSQSNVQTVDEISSLPADLLPIEKVQEIAGQHNTSATITSIELESENGQLLYLVRFSDGTSVLFNAKTGATITGISIDEDLDKTDDLPQSFTLNISITKAVEIAKAQYPNGMLKQVELEVEGGKVVYSVKFTDGTKISVDGSTGTIVKSQPKSNDSSNDSSSENSGSSTGDDSKDSADDLSEDTTNTQSNETESHDDKDSGTDTSTGHHDGEDN